jgi:hypothetical protein
MSYYLNVKVNLQQLVMSKVCKEEREREKREMSTDSLMSKFARSGH